ncbi:MAG: LysM peptidoglycan-binding domain-containing protein [Pseudomonadales bacterium]|nr:LysM peptidoglycan-binding domain-containing protein [Pseudomonadales bacterium]
MMKSFLRLVGGCLLVIATGVSAVELRPGHPDVYPVKEGDTLWDISSAFLKDPWLWPELWHVNPQIKNPHLIYPGDLIKLVYIDGKPSLTIERGPMVFKKGDTVKLTPQIRSEPLKSVIPAIPLELIQSFLVNNRVMTEEEIDSSPYILAGDESHIVMGLGDYLYARGDWENAHQAYGIYRKGPAYVDPETQEVLGFAALDKGMARMETVEGDIARMKVTDSKEDIRPKDRLIPTEERKVDSIFYPKSPDGEVNGEILHVFSGVRNVSQNDVVVINRGAREGMMIGDVLAVKTKGEVVKDRITGELVKLPDQRRGIMMIFRTFEKVSYGLILRSEAPLSVGDVVTNPE